MMTRDELLAKLLELAKETNQPGYVCLEEPHENADQALLTYIDDAEIRDAFNDIEKWYA